MRSLHGVLLVALLTGGCYQASCGPASPDPIGGGNTTVAVSNTTNVNVGSGQPTTGASPVPSDGTCPQLTTDIKIGCFPGGGAGDCPSSLPRGGEVRLNATPHTASGASTCHGPASWTTNDARICTLSGAVSGLDGFIPDLHIDEHAPLSDCVATVMADGHSASIVFHVSGN